MMEFYNKFEGLKEAFIEAEANSDGTRKNWDYLFRKTKPFEEEINKDLCEMNRDELKNLWIGVDARSYMTLQGFKNNVKNYIDFAINHNYNETGINWANSFNSDELKDCIGKIWIENQIITRDDLENIRERCENDQDAAIFYLLFEGVWGEGMEELINLKKTDIDKANNKLKLRKTDKTTGELDERIIDVSPECIDTVVGAADEDEYIGNNGNINKRTQMTSVRELVDSDYVLRSTLTKRKSFIDNDFTSMQTISKRLKIIKNAISDDEHNYLFLNPSNIRISGMIDYAIRYMEEKKIKPDNLTMKDYQHISVRFGGNPHTIFNNVKNHIYRYIKDVKIED